MSKINARSPFYVSYSTPTKPTVALTCELANGSGFEINQEGLITEPTFEYGQIDSFTSSDSGFSDNKYAVVTVDTVRSVVFKITIPSEFSNSSDGYLDCTLQYTQPKKVTSGTTPTCSGGPTLNGSVGTQTLASGGNTVTVNLASYFSAGSSSIAGYTINNPHPGYMSASVAGSTLTITSGNNGGTAKKLYVSAFDNDANTCKPVQPIAVTINVSTAFACADANLKGGAIAQNGVITDPNLVGTITKRKLTSGGSTISGPPYNAGANSTSGEVTKSLFFDITAPSNYSNAGVDITNCELEFKQPGTTSPTLVCADITFTEQGIYTDGTVKQGKASVKGVEATITGWSPNKWDSISVAQDRSMTFDITVPSGYSNAGNPLTGCPLTVAQPADIPVCGSNTFYFSFNFVGGSETAFCQSGIPTRMTTAMLSTASSLDDGYGNQVCNANGTPFAGNSQFYAVSTTSNSIPISSNTGSFYIWQIDNAGTIIDVWHWDCVSGGDGDGSQI